MIKISLSFGEILRGEASIGRTVSREGSVGKLLCRSNEQRSEGSKEANHVERVAGRGRNERSKFQEELEGQCSWNAVNQGRVERLGVSLSQGPDHGRPCQSQKGVWIYFLL